jgi:acyl CoA:acetate/3-ketoacid CoA transferase beta subunit
VTLRQTYLFGLAVLVAAFVALYPFLSNMGMCDSGECPYATQSSSHTSSAALPSVCVSAVLTAFPAMLVFALLRGHRLAAAHWRPMQLYLSPDPPPPRSLLSR